MGLCRNRSPSIAVHVNPTLMKPRASSPFTKTEALQLWVEHGANVSARSAILISKWNGHHAAAVDAQAHISIQSAVSNMNGDSLTASAVNDRRERGPRFFVSRDKLQRQTLRRLRSEKLMLITVIEETAKKRAEEEKQAALEAKQRAVDLEKRQREAELLEKSKQQASEANQQAPPNSVPHPSPIPTLSIQQTQISSSDNKSSASTLRDAPSDASEPKNVRPVSESNNLRPEVAQKANAEVATDEIPEDIEKITAEWMRICEAAEPFRKDYSMKKGRMALKKKVNLAVNQISASEKQVTSKVQDLCAVLNEARAVGGPSGEAFAMKEISQRLVSESDSSVALSRATAFAVGAVIVGVAGNAGDPGKMREVFLGAFYEHCIYTIPTYGRKRKDESHEDFRLRIGYRDGENPEGYMERACGCISLYAAVLQTDKVYGTAAFGGVVANPFSLDEGWTWFARIVNGKQRSITPAIVYAFLETAGYSMSKRYRRQFAKLMAMIQRATVLGAVKSAPRGPTSRLDGFIEEFVSAGCVISKVPEGRTLPSTDAEFL